MNKQIIDINESEGIFLFIYEKNVMPSMSELISLIFDKYNDQGYLKLTNSYCTFVNGGKKVESKMIKRIQDRRGKTIYNSEDRTCGGCDIFREKNNSLLKILDNRPKIIRCLSLFI